MARGQDPTGAATLELFRQHDAYSEFLWESLSALSPRPIAGRLLEVGAGIGNLTRILLRLPGVEFLQAIDLDPAYVERVRAELPDGRLRVTAARAEEYCPREYCREWGREDGAAGEGSAAAGRGGAFHAIVSTNVLEHIDGHERVLENFRRMLRPDGVVLILVPAHPFLYSELDRSLSHYRRYRPRDFRRLALEAGLEVVRMRHFNPVGALGWWLNGKVLRRRLLPAGQLALYNRFGIPLSRLADRLNPLPFGVSLLVVLSSKMAGV